MNDCVLLGPGTGDANSLKLNDQKYGRWLHRNRWDTWSFERFSASNMYVIWMKSVFQHVFHNLISHFCTVGRASLLFIYCFSTTEPDPVHRNWAKYPWFVVQFSCLISKTEQNENRKKWKTLIHDVKIVAQTIFVFLFILFYVFY